MAQIRTDLGRVRIEKQAQVRNLIDHVRITVTLDDEDPEKITRIVSTSREPQTRNAVTGEWVSVAVQRMIDGRKDLEGRTIRGVRVEVVNTVWDSLFTEDPQEAKESD